MPFDSDSWRARLAAHHTQNGLLGGSLSSVLSAERAHAVAAAQKFHNFSCLSDACLAFVHDSIESAETLRIRTVDSPDNYGIVLLEFAAVFRQMRSACVVALAGYPTQGFALLRDVKDRALQFCAWLHGISDQESTSGNVELRDGLPGPAVRKRIAFNKRHSRRRSAEQRRIADLLAGKHSGISSGDQESLDLWFGVFHHEVHGARLMSASTLSGDWLRGAGPLPLSPAGDALAMRLFLTNFTLVSWMVHRTLPLLQTHPAALGLAWQRGWDSLDHAFAEFVDALPDDKSHRVITAVSRWIRTKFPFQPHAHCYTVPQP